LATLAALGSALCIGAADFTGGWASRKQSPLLITLWINVVALVAVAIACVLGGPRISESRAIAALVGGCVSGAAINLIYASFAAGAMSLTAPLVACGTAILPTLTATVAGQPPDAVQGVGIVFALAGVIAITWRPPARSAHVSLSRRALVLTALASVGAGAAISILLLAAKGGSAVALGVSGLSRLTTFGTCLLFVLVTRTPARLPRALAPPVLGAGLLEVSGVTLFLLASSLGSTAVVAVLVSLNAIITVMLAQTVLREQIASHQRGGIAFAAIGVALLSAG
jgi:drug/metabolite transporter (DMT)-like permease